MRRTTFGLCFIVVTLATSLTWTAGQRPAPRPAEPAGAAPYRTEQEWIVSDVVGAIAGMASGAATPEFSVTADSVAQSTYAVRLGGAGEAIQVRPAPHLWAPETFSAVAAKAFPAPGATSLDVDLSIRTPLATLTTDSILDANARVSALLEMDMRSAAAHESAALIIGALGLREAARLFSDERPALSRMAAHLAVAGVLRGSRPEGFDGALARAILTALSGLQRDALVMVDALAPRARTRDDRAWLAALRLRITGNWRAVTVKDDDRLVAIRVRTRGRRAAGHRRAAELR